MASKARLGMVTLCCVVTLFATACTTSGDSEAPEEPEATDPQEPEAQETEEASGPRETGLDLCALVSEETLSSAADIVEVSDGREEQREALIDNAETFVGCHTPLGGAQAISWGVRDPEFISEPSIDFLFTAGEVGETLDQEPVSIGEIDALIGGRAWTISDEPRFEYIASFEYDGLEVIVKLLRMHGDADAAVAGRDYLEQLIQEIHGNMDGTAPEPVDFGEVSCPPPDDPRITEALDGEVMVARSRTEGYLVAEGFTGTTCTYANDRVFADLRMSWTTSGETLLSVTPSTRQERTDFNGYPADIQQRMSGTLGSVVMDEECRLDASQKRTGPMLRDFIHLYPSDGEPTSEEELLSDRENRIFTLFEVLDDHGNCGD